jgi:hypothetical protein
MIPGVRDSSIFLSIYFMAVAVFGLNMMLTKIAVPPFKAKSLLLSPWDIQTLQVQTQREDRM